VPDNAKGISVVSIDDTKYRELFTHLCANLQALSALIGHAGTFA
jgi:hypothetical protein